MSDWDTGDLNIYRGLCYAGKVTAVSATTPTTTFTSKFLRNFTNDYFNNEYYAQIIKSTDAAAPEPELRKVTDYVSSSGQFVTDAFSVAVEVSDHILLLHESVVAIGRNDTNNIFDSSSVRPNKDGSLLERSEFIMGQIAGIGGGGGGGSSGGANVGNTYYISPTGNDTTGDGSNTSPWATLDFAISQCTADHDDIIICMPGAYDESANTDGVQIDVDGVTIVGSGSGKQQHVTFVNSNAAATSVLNISGDKIIINNITIIETTTTVEGIVGTGDDVLIQECGFIGAMENAIHPTGGRWIIMDSLFNGMTNDGIEAEGDNNNIINNMFTDVGDNAISAIAGADDNIIYRNVINGIGNTTTGINIAADDNMVVSNWICRCTNPTADTGSNNKFVDNHEDFTKINNTLSTTWDDVQQIFATLWAANGANVFNPTIYGSARTDLETALNNMANYFSPSAASWSVQLFNQVAKTNLEQTLEDFFSAMGISGADVWTNISGATPADFDAVIQSICTTIGINVANTFSTTIQGANQATLEAAYDALATYFSASGAAMVVKMMNGTNRANFELIWEDYLTALGIDGTNVWTQIMGQGAPASLNAYLQQIATAFGIENAQVFTQIMGQGVPADLDKYLQQMAAALGVSGANVWTQVFGQGVPASLNAYLQQIATALGVENAQVWTEINDLGAPTDLDDYLQDFASLWGANGTNIFSPVIGGVARTTLETALEALDVLSGGGLVFKAIVTTATDATHFKSTDLVGYGNDRFMDYGGWYVVPVWDAAGLGGAPQGEQQLITDFISSDGTVQHAAFTLQLALTDIVYIVHPWIVSLGRMGDTATADDLSNIATTSMQAKLQRLLLRFSANAFSPTINNAAQTTLALALSALNDILVSATGVASWSAKAKPANGVSLSEGIRFIAEHEDPTTGTHNIEIVHGTDEQTIVSYTPTLNEEIECQVDIATLITAVEGGTVTLRLKDKIDAATARTIDMVTFLVGTDEVYPVVKGRCRAGAGYCVITIQCSVAVTAQRACPYVIFQGGA